jgi:hypothetical protein
VCLKQAVCRTEQFQEFVDCLSVKQTGMNRRIKTASNRPWNFELEIIISTFCECAVSSFLIEHRAGLGLRIIKVGAR